MIAYLNGRKIKGVEFNESGGLDFSVIGYDEAPDYLQNDFDYAKQIYDNWDASVTDRGKEFSGDTKLVFCPAVDTSNVTNFYSFFRDCKNLKIVPKLKTSNPTNMGHMFYYCSGLTSLDVSNFNTSKVTTMNQMFGNCRSLTSLDVSNFNTSAVTDMSSMFGYCEALTSLDVSNFDTSKVTNMSYMFNSCWNLTSLDVSNFDTSKVTTMENMFQYDRVLTSITFGVNFDTSNVTRMNSVFEGCSGLTSLDLSKWDFSNIFQISSFFRDCKKLRVINLGNINCAKVTSTTASYLFSNCHELRKIDCTNFINAPKLTKVEFTSSSYLGVNSEEVPDAREALTATFATNSFDRATAGLSTVTLKFHANTKALLTTDEIAQITAKGFTIA